MERSLKKRHIFRKILFVIALFVFCFAAFKIIAGQLAYKEGRDEYEHIREIAEKEPEDSADPGSGIDWNALRQNLLKLADILGIREPEETILDADIEALIEERQAARKAKNYARADEIRKELADRGILLEDTKEGVKWKRK